MMRRTAVSVTLPALLWMSFILLSGCEESYRTRALFTKPELYTYERHAVLGLDPEQEQIFMAAYVKTFSGRIITFVERNRIAAILGEQDLLKGRLNDRMRAKLQEVLGVEALIMCEYSVDEEARQTKLRVRIVDSETGAIVGSVLTDTYKSFDAHARAAVEALKADVLGGVPRAYYNPSPTEPQ